MLKVNVLTESEIITEADPEVFEPGFTIVPNDIINHKELSPRAKLLIIYLIEKSPNFNFHDSGMKNFLDCGRDALESAFKDLRKAGYVKNVSLLKEGKFQGSKRVFSRYPKFKVTELKTAKVQEALKSRARVAPGPGKPGIDVTNTRSCTNTNKNNNSTKIPHEPVVVSLGEKQMELVEQLKSNGIPTKEAIDWVRIYGNARIVEILEHVKLKELMNPGGWIRNAVLQEWKLHKPKRKSKSVETEYETDSGKILEWFKGKWANFSNEQKINEFNRIRGLHGNGMFQMDTLRYPAVNVVSKSFVEEPIFAEMVHHAGYKIKRLESKPIENSEVGHE